MFRFRYDDYARLFGMQRAAVRQAVRRKKFDPASLESVLRFAMERRLGSAEAIANTAKEALRTIEGAGEQARAVLVETARATGLLQFVVGELDKPGPEAA